MIGLFAELAIGAALDRQVRDGLEDRLGRARKRCRRARSSLEPDHHAEIGEVCATMNSRSHMPALHFAAQTK
jgi:hypothetical protein